MHTQLSVHEVYKLKFIRISTSHEPGRAQAEKQRMEKTDKEKTRMEANRSLITHELSWLTETKQKIKVK